MLQIVNPNESFKWIERRVLMLVWMVLRFRGANQGLIKPWRYLHADPFFLALQASIIVLKESIIECSNWSGLRVYAVIWSWSECWMWKRRRILLQATVATCWSWRWKTDRDKVFWSQSISTQVRRWVITCQFFAAQKTSPGSPKPKFRLFWQVELWLLLLLHV